MYFALFVLTIKFYELLFKKCNNHKKTCFNKRKMHVNKDEISFAFIQNLLTKN